MTRTVGVVAIQGDFERHILALERAGGPDLKVRKLRTPEDLAGIERAILPGGESTTVGKLLQRFGLGEALAEAARAGMPLWGTCMGMILMARDIAGYPEQYRLALMDIEVERNAFGAQVHSFETELELPMLETPFTGVFIRAPAVTRMGAGVKAFAETSGRVVGVAQENLLGTSFHPEMTDDPRFHEWFLALK